MTSCCWAAIADPTISAPCINAKVPPYWGALVDFHRALELVKEGYVLALVEGSRTYADTIGPSTGHRLFRQRHMVGKWEVIDYKSPP